MKQLRILLKMNSWPEYWEAANEKNIFNETKVNTQKELWTLLDSISNDSDSVKEVYLDVISSLEYINNTKSMERHNIYPQLFADHKKLLWPKYKNDEYAQRAIRVLDLMFMDQRAKVSEIKEPVISFLDDKQIPDVLKKQMVTYLCGNYFGSLFESEPSLDWIDKNLLDEDLKQAYDFAENYEKLYKDKKIHWEENISTYFTNIHATEKTLHSPKYKNDKNAEKIRMVLYDAIGSWSPMHDFEKTTEIEKFFKEKYPQYDWNITYDMPLD